MGVLKNSEGARSRAMSVESRGDRVRRNSHHEERERKHVRFAISDNVELLQLGGEEDEVEAMLASKSQTARGPRRVFGCALSHVGSAPAQPRATGLLPAMDGCSLAIYDNNPRSGISRPGIRDLNNT